VRGLIPQHVNLMALTATASDITIGEIIHDISMYNPVVVQVSPDKPNLLYCVQKSEGLRNSFMPLIMLLKSKRLKFIRTIIFCTRQTDCGNLYQLFEATLKEQFTEPVGTPVELPDYRLVNIFTKATEDYIKSSVLKQCADANSCLRVVICTAAFGMGIDCADFNRTIHFGPPDDVETYIQQTGRAGRNGKQSYCYLFIAKNQMRFCDKNMKIYCENTVTCRRDSLFSGFSSYKSLPLKCNCCDVCAEKCKCVKCLDVMKGFQ